MENNNNNQGGRPSLTKEELETIVQKLEPHLKTGKTLRKACLLAEVPHSSVYNYYNNDEWFMDKIDTFMAYSSNIVNNLFFNRLVGIAKKDQGMQKLQEDLKAGKIKKEEFEKLQAEYSIAPEDWAFIKWYAVNTNSTRGEYGSRMELTGKDGAPLQENDTIKEVAGMLQELLNPDEPDTKPETERGNTEASS